MRRARRARRSRAQVIRRLGRAQVIAAVLLLGACKTYKSDNSGYGTPSDATYEAAPGRQVYGDGPIGGGGTGGQAPGDGPVSSSDAAPVDTRPPPDRAPAPDLEPDLSGPTDVGPSGCDLIKQDCPERNQACYPTSGRGVCQMIDFGLQEGSPCGMNSGCDRGLACVEGTCRPLCDSSQPSSCRQGRCMPLTGFSGVGYCLP